MVQVKSLTKSELSSWLTSNDRMDIWISGGVVTQFVSGDSDKLEGKMVHGVWITIIDTDRIDIDTDRIDMDSNPSYVRNFIIQQERKNKINELFKT